MSVAVRGGTRDSRTTDPVPEEWAWVARLWEGYREDYRRVPSQFTYEKVMQKLELRQRRRRRFRLGMALGAVATMAALGWALRT